MIKKDILLRWTQELAKVISLLLGKDPEEAMDILEEALVHQLDIDTDFISETKQEDLVELLQEKGLDAPRMEFLAEILLKQGQLLYANKQFVESKDKFEKALIIFDYTDSVLQIFSFERVSKLSEIKKLINQI